MGILWSGGGAESNCGLLLQSYHMLIAQTEAEELPTVSVNPYFSFGPVTKAVSEMKQHLNEFSNEELVKVAKAGERRVPGAGGGAGRGLRGQNI